MVILAVEAEEKDYAVPTVSGASGSVTAPGAANVASVAVSKCVWGSTPTSFADSHRCVEECRDMRAAQELRAVVILAAGHGTVQRAPHGIVVERDARIIKKSREAGPAFEHVADGFPSSLRGKPTCSVAHTLMRSVIARPCLAQLMSERLRGGVSRKAARHETLDGVEFANQLVDLLALVRRLAGQDAIEGEWAWRRPTPCRPPEPPIRGGASGFHRHG